MSALNYQSSIHPLVLGARSLGDALIERSSETADLRRLPESTVDDLKQRGLMSALVPKDLGGAEVGLDVFYDIVQELGKVDGSVSWTYSIMGSASWMVSTFYSEAVSREVFESDNPLTSAVLAPTRISAQRVDGGVRINEGEWSFNSGIHHAGWNILGIPIINEQGVPTHVFHGLVPVSALTILDDWNSIGLRGSGSSSVRVDNLFIPDERLISHENILSEVYPNDRVSLSTLYKQAVVPTIMVKMSSTAIAIAKGALDRFIDNSVKRKIAMTFYPKQSDAPVTHLQVGEATAKIDAADTIARHSIDEIERAAKTGRRFTREQKARIWRDAAFSSRLAWEAVDLLADASGGSFAREDNSLNHCWRDLRVAVSHAGLSINTVYEVYGRVIYDLPSNTPLLPG
ncbi:acyl-CoA dehydrogenase family protein [Rhizobium sp. 2MFCol3.1]|uniref:acyl-CoA dehydrogenase family protein n=1 Tax=Rhizobium sp. 2MFCol3.1 TaxID=1246459 RepID=UPI0018CA0280|nr:acyl-CoA dehydrogenase family protein [Rhizobium sp. 2MFCol3.1]